jgi:hypothetical protein
MYNRSPLGFDNPGQLDRQFNDACLKQIKAEVAKEADESRRQQVHQKVEVGPIHRAFLGNDRAQMAVDCQILRQRVFGGQVINDARHIQVQLDLAVNQKMDRSGKFPLEVVSFKEIDL